MARRSTSSWGLIALSLLVLGIWLWVGSAPPAPESTGTDQAPRSERGDREPTSAPDTRDPVSGLAWVEVEALPEEAAETIALIDAGGPFPYPEDDETFGNFEGILPSQPRGYYREYTVDTPGLTHRGARRIVVGSGGEFYWTSDHYASFQRIRR